MADISVQMGSLSLKSPIIVSSSGLTKNVGKVKEYVDAGAGAIVIKSLFEEQISMKCQSMSEMEDYTEAYDYIAEYVKGQEVSEYLDTIKKLKEAVSVPVLASINCAKSDTWIEFASNIETSGADGIEINFMAVETDVMAEPSKVEDHYVGLISKLRKSISIPIWVKLSPYHTALPSFVDKLRASGAEGVTLFNRGFQADINIDKEEVTSADVFTHDGDFSTTLRYTGLIAGLVKGIAVSSSTGVHSGKEVVKAILAGAVTTQMCTAIYKGGANAIASAIEFLEQWMDQHGYRSIEEFRARLSYGNIPSAVTYERMQFMKYFSSRKD